jgi:hypothetical protein
MPHVPAGITCETVLISFPPEVDPNYLLWQETIADFVALSNIEAAKIAGSIN